MNKLLIFLMALIATNSFGQITKYKPLGSSPNVFQNKIIQNSDTTLRVVMVDQIESFHHKPAFFVNGIHLIDMSLSPDHIEALEVIKRDTLIGNLFYKSQIHLNTKSDYTPEFISLTELKEKYTDFKSKPVVFIVDGEFVNDNYDNYLVDEKYILTIIVDKLQQSEIGLIKLLTKTKENIKKRNSFRIRGSEVGMEL